MEVGLATDCAFLSIERLRNEEAIRVRKEPEQRMYGEFLDWYYAAFPVRPTKKKREAKIQEGDLSDN